MTRLRSCDACARHVFVTETRCPFCAAALEPVSNSPIFNIKPGMSRAQRFTLVAAVAGQTLLGCSDDPKTGLGNGSLQGSGTGGAASNAGTGGAGVAMPVYGAPVAPGTGTGGSSGSAAGNGGSSGGNGSGGKGPIAQPVYGAPIPVDAAVATDGGDVGDAAVDAGMKDAGPSVQPVYGAPIPVYGVPPLPDK